MQIWLLLSVRIRGFGLWSQCAIFSLRLMRIHNDSSETLFFYGLADLGIMILAIFIVSVEYFFLPAFSNEVKLFNFWVIENNLPNNNCTVPLGFTPPLPPLPTCLLLKGILNYIFFFTRKIAFLVFPSATSDIPLHCHCCQMIHMFAWKGVLYTILCSGVPFSPT